MTGHADFGLPPKQKLRAPTRWPPLEVITGPSCYGDDHMRMPSNRENTAKSRRASPSLSRSSSRKTPSNTTSSQQCRNDFAIRTPKKLFSKPRSTIFCGRIKIIGQAEIGLNDTFGQSEIDMKMVMVGGLSRNDFLNLGNNAPKEPSQQPQNQFGCHLQRSPPASRTETRDD